MTRKILYASAPAGLVLVLCLLGFEARAQQTQASIPGSAPMPREDRIRIFDQVWRAIYDNYYDKRFKGLDWRTQRDIYRPQAEAAQSSADLYRVLRQMLGKLGDAHTRIYSPDDGFDRHRPSGTTIGVVVRRVEGKAVVTSVDPASDAAKVGKLSPGSAVIAIDGTPVEKVLERIRSEIGDSSTSIALELQSFDRLFHGPRDTPVQVTFSDEEGKQRTLMLTRRYVEFQRRVTVRKLPHKIGYIEMTGFGPEIERDFDAAMQSMQGTRGLILDLRNNGGGFVTTVAQAASYFFPEETNLGEFITRQGRATPRQTQRLRSHYREPLIVLVSSRSASGSEIFAAAMQERKRALIIGSNETTCGCLLGVSRTLRLADGGKLNVSDTDYRTSMGRRIEGAGVKPDQQIEIRVVDLLANRDRTFDTATELLARAIVFGSRNSEIEFKLNIPDLSARSSSRLTPSLQLLR
ncbi:MAG: S41 family peptidase [Blastocatellia bacterium]